MITFPSISRRRAFSLIELLLVITMMGILLGLSAMGLSALRSQEIAGATDQLAGEIAYSLQLAAVKNEAIEIRFYESPGLDDSALRRFRGYQLVTRDPLTGTAKAIDRYRQFGGNLVLHPSDQITTLLQLTRQQVQDIETLGLPAGTESFVAFRVKPDGTTSLTPDLQWSLTLVFDTAALGESEVPKNARTILVNPVTGGIRTY